MYSGNKLTTIFVILMHALEKVSNQDEHNMYVSMFDQDELECQKYAQRLQTYANKQVARARPTPTRGSRSEISGRTKGRPRRRRICRYDFGANEHVQYIALMPDYALLFACVYVFWSS